MLYKIIYHYDSSINLDNVYDKLVEEMVAGQVTEAIANCMEIKRSGSPVPKGFSIISYDEYDHNNYETKNFYINGILIDRTNISKDWDNNLLNKDVQKLVYVNENFCVPFNESTDTILTVANL